MTTEDERAEAFRASERARLAYKRRANAALAAPLAPRRTVMDNWEAVTKWLAERRQR